MSRSLPLFSLGNNNPTIHHPLCLPETFFFRQNFVLNVVSGERCESFKEWRKVEMSEGGVRGGFFYFPLSMPLSLSLSFYDLNAAVTLHSYALFYSLLLLSRPSASSLRKIRKRERESFYIRLRGIREGERKASTAASLVLTESERERESNDTVLHVFFSSNFFALFLILWNSDGRELFFHSDSLIPSPLSQVRRGE